MELTLPQTIYCLWTGSFLYTLAFLFALFSVLKKQPYIRNIFYTLLILGFSLQSLGIYARGLQLGNFPMTNPMEILQIIGWTTIFLTFIVQLAFRLRLLAFFGSALASIVGILSISIPQWSLFNHHSLLYHNPWIGFHVALAIFAYGTFALLAIASIMYLIQDYGLSHKRFGGFFGLLPSLRQVDELMRRLLVIGVASLTVAVGVGTLIWLEHREELSLGKMISTWGLWITYLGTLLIQRKNNISARILAWVFIILFMMAMLSLWPIQV